MGDLEAPPVRSAMHRYSIFGGSFATTLALPELAPSTDTGRADWVLERVEGLDPGGVWTACGASTVDDGVGARLLRNEGGTLRLVYDDTGTFEIDAAGDTIRWCPPDDVDEDAARKDVLGRVFAVAFRQRGVVTFHGSAVDLDGAGLCFLAPKFHGKSTTAAALVDAGARLLGDDLVVVDRQGPDAVPHLLPTWSTVHLWPDATAAAVGRAGAPVGEGGASAKRGVRYEPPPLDGPAPLQGIYLLAPATEHDVPLARTRLAGTTAAMGLLGQLKVGDLLGPEEVLTLLPVARALVDRVGVYRLDMPRGLDRLRDVVVRLRSWHGVPRDVAR